jgi:DNA segregation ATPase FtsK/SpoIIIE, S-DNA-T family
MKKKKDSVKPTKLTEEQKVACTAIEERSTFFGCPGKVVGVKKGPVITLYEFEPGKATRVKKLQSLQEDLALALSADAVMVRRIAGRNLMAIEISNKPSERKNILFRDTLERLREAKRDGMKLPLNLGTDPFGVQVVDDLADLPHLLIAGSTGSGKSVSLNCFISSLIMTCSPQELQFYMIDPKGVELIHYNGIPHMKIDMVTSPHYAKDMLERLSNEMRHRLQRLTSERVRDIHELNLILKGREAPLMPRIVLIVDELGDLMLQDKKEFSRLFAEIAQMARATGIHMICATQRPSVDVLSGKIKVNFPARMSFRVTSSIDSKTIVQTKGAEGLLGRGDMLYLSPARSGLMRIHAPWVPLDDVKKLAEKIRKIEEARVAVERKKEQDRLAEEAKKLEELRRKEEAKRIKEDALKAKEENAKPNGQSEDTKLPKDFEIDWAK